MKTPQLKFPWQTSVHEMILEFEKNKLAQKSDLVQARIAAGFSN